MGVVNNVSTITSWEDYLNKIAALKYPTSANLYGFTLRIKNSSGDYFYADLKSIINGEVSFAGTPVEVFYDDGVYSLKNITATINGEDIDYNFEINDNVQLLKLFPEGLNFSIWSTEPNYPFMSLSSNGLPEYAFEKNENGDLKPFEGNYSIENSWSWKSLKVYENTLEGNILAPEDAYPTINDDKLLTEKTNVILSEKNDATYFDNVSLIPSEELPEELTERIEKVISGEITFSIPENVPFIEIQETIFSEEIQPAFVIVDNNETKSAFYLPLNKQVKLEFSFEYASVPHSEGLSVVDLGNNELSVTNDSMAENGFIRFSNEPEPEPPSGDEEAEWWAMMIALGRA